jgi:hypothetical protein
MGGGGGEEEEGKLLVFNDTIGGPRAPALEGTHAEHMQNTCGTHAEHMRNTCGTHAEHMRNTCIERRTIKENNQGILKRHAPVGLMTR